MKKNQMMIKRNFLMAGVFCVAMVFSASVLVQNAQASVMYISKRIKIVRPETQKVQPAKKIEAVTPQPVEPTMKSEKAAMKEAPKVIKRPSVQTAAASSKPGATAEQLSPEMLFGKQAQYYSRKDRIDPFAPFLHKPETEAASQGPEAIRRKPLTPLEKIAIQQLKLTAILSSPGSSYALVQEPSGKGYILNKGTYIGEKGGRVSQILKDRVIIEEEYRDVFGKTAVRKIELKLKNAGE